MRHVLILFLVAATGHSVAQSPDLCDRLDDLVNEVIPESFEDVSYEEAAIEEVAGDKVYRKMNYPFIGADYVYYTEDGETNKRLLCYPLVSEDKDQAVQRFLALKTAFDQCELVYTSVRQNPNPNIGLLAFFTIGLDRRFYNSNMRLYQYQSDTTERYWIEYELIAPKQESE